MTCLVLGEGWQKMRMRTCFNRKLRKGVGEQILSKETALSKPLKLYIPILLKQTNKTPKLQKPTVSAREKKTYVFRKNLGIL